MRIGTLKMRQKSASTQFPERALKVIEWCASSSDVRTHRVARAISLQIAKDPELGALFASAWLRTQRRRVRCRLIFSPQTRTRAKARTVLNPCQKPKIATEEVKEEEIVLSSQQRRPLNNHDNNNNNNNNNKTTIPDNIASSARANDCEKEERFPNLNRGSKTHASDLFGGPSSAMHAATTTRYSTTICSTNYH